MKKINNYTEKAMRRIGLVTVSLIVLLGVSVLVSAGMNWMIHNVGFVGDIYYGSNICEYMVGAISSVAALKVIEGLHKRTFSEVR